MKIALVTQTCTWSVAVVEVGEGAEEEISFTEASEVVSEIEEAAEEAEAEHAVGSTPNRLRLSPLPL